MEEVERLAEAIAPRFKALVLVGAYGGLRIGEIGGLRRGRVDILKGRIEVVDIAVEVKDNGGGRLRHGPPKTKAGRRSITLPQFVVQMLNEHLASYTEADPQAFVFTGPEGGPLRVSLWRQRQWRDAVTAADLTPLTPHDLRHTAVALWIKSGANVLEVSRRAGHTSVSFTLDRYGHLFPEADLAVADRLDAMVTDEKTARASATISKSHGQKTAKKSPDRPVAV
jgi:integrase